MKLKKIAALLAIAGLSTSAFATNGMNMEAYGPIAAGVGGASFAYDNGTAALANNPATLGFMSTGTSRFDFALGGLHPDVTSKMTGQPNAPSGGDAYYMPGFGYVRKDGQLTWGLGMMAQGGMGTEYGANSFLSQGTGQDSRSEVGVGRLIFPLVYSVNDNLNIGGSLDWVWATMDIKMAASAAQFGAMRTGMTAGLGAALAGAPFNTATTYRIDFSDDNDYSGKAYGSGFAGKLGITYKFSPVLTVGATYHSKTSLGDMETHSGGASFSAFNNGVGLGGMDGKITIHNFQWPETYGLGMAYQATEKLMIAADYKRINWSKVMKDFNMTFSTGALGGADSASFKISQNWDDQDVFMIGASYQVNDALTVRFGGNFANNPVPDNRMHPLFPAIIKDHYTAGFGYKVSKQSDLDFALSYAPKVTVTGTQLANGANGSGVTANAMTVEHSQLNWQFQYSHRF